MKFNLRDKETNQRIWFPLVAFPLTQVRMKLPLCFLVFIGFLSIFVLYVTHLTPFVAGGDSAELITSAYLLGVPHPPGYPLFNVMGKLFSLIPISNIAWRINLSSAVFHLGASFFIYLSLYRLIKFWPAALLGSLFYSFFPLIWDYSLKAEVFPLNNLFAAFIVYLTVLSREYQVHYELGTLDKKSYERKSRIMVYLILFICGLALTNHHTIILLSPGVFFVLYSYHRSVLSKELTQRIAVCAFLIGLMVYLYIPIRAHAEPYINWDDAQTLHGFINLVTRSDYGSFKLVVFNGDVCNTGEKYLLYCSHLLKQIGPFGLILTLLGFLFLFRQKEKKLGFILLLFYLFSSFVFLDLANVIRNDALFLGVLERFYMLSLVFIAVFMGLGIYFLHQILLLYFKEKKIGLILRGLLLLLIMMASLMPLKAVTSPNRVIYNYGTNVLNSLEKNAIILVTGDTSINVLIYLQQVEGVRKDVVLLMKDLLYHPWYVQQMKKIHSDLSIPFLKMDNQSNTLAQVLDVNLEKRPIYVSGLIDNLPGLDSSYHFISTGIVTKITKNNINLSEHVKHVEKLWQSYDLNDLKPSFAPTTFEKDIVTIYAAGHFNLGLAYQQIGLDDLSIREFSKALQLNEGVLNVAYKYIGLIYSDRKNDPKNAIANFKAYMRLNSRDKKTKQELLAYIQKHTQAH